MSKLMNRMLMSLTLVGALGLSAQAATVDGFFLGGEYSSVITDVDGEGLYQGNMDIDGMGFHKDTVGGFLHIGLEVETPPVALSGSANTIAGQTILFTTLYLDAAGTIPGFQLIAASDGSTETFGLLKHNGVNWAPVALVAGDYDLTFGESIELRVKLDKLAGLPETFRFNAQLDDSGMDPDDQLTGVAVVPVPAAAWAGLGLMGLIGAKKMRRRNTL